MMKKKMALKKTMRMMTTMMIQAIWTWLTHIRAEIGSSRDLSIMISLICMFLRRQIREITMIYFGISADNCLISLLEEIEIGQTKLHNLMRNGVWKRCKHPGSLLALESTETQNLSKLLHYLKRK
jgi:hypothetical protein